MPSTKRALDGTPISTFTPEALLQFVDAMKSLVTYSQGHNHLDHAIGLVNKFATVIEQSCQPTPTRAATSFDNPVEAARAVSVIYHHTPDHLWQFRTTDALSDGQLSAWADTCVEKIKSSSYFELARSETTCRTALDIIMCDRLERLGDQQSTKQLNYFPEVALSVYSQYHRQTITGRADDCLAYGDKNDLQTALVVLEAKKPGLGQAALSQLIIYLAAVQDRRKAAIKKNTCVFGLFTDSDFYWFVHLDEDRKLFASKAYEWPFEKVQIVQWIDKILHDAIEATPNTTPSKTGNTTINNYPSYLNESFQFGTVQDVENRDTRRYVVIRRLSSGDVTFQLEEDEQI